MARIPFPEDVEPDLVESQRPDSLPEKYSHLNQQAARNVYRSIAHEPEVVRSFRAHLSATWEHCGLSDRERELLILAVAREIDSEYEWHQHVRIALLEGLTPEEILAVSEGDFSGFTEKEQAIMEFSQAAAADETTDEHVERLSEFLSVEHVSGTTALVGAYVALNVTLAALDVETEEPFVGWQLEGLEK
jgi:4-carboxymuconolactone decarboxylase